MVRTVFDCRGSGTGRSQRHKGAELPGVDKDFAERNKAWRDGKDFVQPLQGDRKLVETPYNTTGGGSPYPEYIIYGGPGYCVDDVETFTKPEKLSSIGIYSEREMAIARAKIERACRNL